MRVSIRDSAYIGIRNSFLFIYKTLRLHGDWKRENLLRRPTALIRIRGPKVSETAWLDFYP